jgi:hypothetical protein
MTVQHDMETVATDNKKRNYINYLVQCYVKYLPLSECIKYTSDSGNVQRNSHSAKKLPNNGTYVNKYSVYTAPNYKHNEMADNNNFLLPVSHKVKCEFSLSQTQTYT